uniref:Uncharacterized protein n=1 Tax=Rhizophora mucronata TaxID=61149 RepID=A0A2P2IQA3_RHIMU
MNRLFAPARINHHQHSIPFKR